MRKILLFAGIAVLSLSWFAHSEQNSSVRQMLHRSNVAFGDLSGFNNAVVLNTSPRMILVRKPGQTMMCPMPDNTASILAQACWEISE